ADIQFVNFYIHLIFIIPSSNRYLPSNRLYHHAKTTDSFIVK
ncbi:hypothetical protein D046_4787B, partial [Vibrio parahaemolyticus V-223/04]